MNLEDTSGIRAETSDLKMRFMDLFPYKPYPEQLEFMKDIESTMLRGGVLVAEACNGFGKTACA